MKWKKETNLTSTVPGSESTGTQETEKEAEEETEEAKKKD